MSDTVGVRAELPQSLGHAARQLHPCEQALMAAPAVPAEGVDTDVLRQNVGRPGISQAYLVEAQRLLRRLCEDHLCGNSQLDIRDRLNVIQALAQIHDRLPSLCRLPVSNPHATPGSAWAMVNLKREAHRAARALLVSLLKDPTGLDVAMVEGLVKSQAGRLLFEPREADRLHARVLARLHPQEGLPAEIWREIGNRVLEAGVDSVLPHMEPMVHDNISRKPLEPSLPPDAAADTVRRALLEELLLPTPVTVQRETCTPAFQLPATHDIEALTLASKTMRDILDDQRTVAWAIKGRQAIDRVHDLAGFDRCLSLLADLPDKPLPVAPDHYRLEDAVLGTSNKRLHPIGDRSRRSTALGMLATRISMLETEDAITDAIAGLMTELTLLPVEQQGVS